MNADLARITNINADQFKWYADLNDMLCEPWDIQRTVDEEWIGILMLLMVIMETPHLRILLINNYTPISIELIVYLFTIPFKYVIND